MYSSWMLSICLDHNCLIDLTVKSENHAPIKAIVDASIKQGVTVSTLGISASERQPGGSYHTNIADHISWLECIGAGRLNLLKPVLTWDVTFWDWSVYASDSDLSLLKKIHEAMFHTIDFNWADYAKKSGVDVFDKNSKQHRKWINAHCDVQGAWASIKYKQDILVTSNIKDFQRNSTKLASLGVKQILTPVEAETLVIGTV